MIIHQFKIQIIGYLAIANFVGLYGRKCAMHVLRPIRGRGSKFVTVCDRGGVKFVKSSVCIRYEQPLISKDYNCTNTIINVQQILVVTFEFISAARGFMITLCRSCAVRGVKKVGQH